MIGSLNITIVNITDNEGKKLVQWFSEGDVAVNVFIYVVNTSMELIHNEICEQVLCLNMTLRS